MKKFIAIIIFLICFNLTLPSFSSDLDSNAYYNRGLSKYKLKDYKGAIEDYTKAIELNPNDSNIYLVRSLDKSRLKDYKGAIEDCNKAIELNPNDTHAYSIRDAIKEAFADSKEVNKLNKYFNSYIKRINKIIKLNWEPPYPTIGTSTIVRYTLNKKGEISNIKIVKSSGILQNDESAVKAIKISSPLPPLPEKYQGTSIDLEFHFDINGK